MKTARFLLAGIFAMVCFALGMAAPGNVQQRMQTLKVQSGGLDPSSVIRSSSAQSEDEDQPTWADIPWKAIKKRVARWIWGFLNPPEPTPNTLKSLNYCGERDVVALTFDDGPHLENAPMILDLVKDRGIKVTFFISPGIEAMERNCTLLQRIIEEGHGVEHHSFTHPDFTALDNDKVEEEITKTQEWVEECLGGPSPMTMFRPPFGALNNELAQLINGLGYTVATWNVDTNDWMGGDADEKTARWAERASFVPDGASSIVLMHDEHYDEAFLSDMITFYADSGHEFVTMAECYDACKDEGEGLCKTTASAWPGVYDV